MTAPITIKRHEAVPDDAGSYEVRFADGRPSVYWDDLPADGFDRIC